MKTILAVDDNRDDLFLLEWALSRSGVEHRLITAGDGVEAEELLDRIEQREDASLPSLIFLDVNMPRLGGLQFLDRFMRQPGRASIPVVMLSSFDDPRDMDKALELGATACLQKPPALKDLHRVVSALTDSPSQFQDGPRSPGWMLDETRNDGLSPAGASPVAGNGTDHFCPA